MGRKHQAQPGGREHQKASLRGWLDLACYKHLHFYALQSWCGASLLQVLVKISNSYCGYLLPYLGNLISQVAANRAIWIQLLAVMHMKSGVFGGQALSNGNSKTGLSGEGWGRGAQEERLAGPQQAAAAWGPGAWTGAPGAGRWEPGLWGCLHSPRARRRHEGRTAHLAPTRRVKFGEASALSEVPHCVWIGFFAFGKPDSHLQCKHLFIPLAATHVSTYINLRGESRTERGEGQEQAWEEQTSPSSTECKLLGSVVSPEGPGCSLGYSGNVAPRTLLCHRLP